MENKLVRRGRRKWWGERERMTDEHNTGLVGFAATQQQTGRWRLITMHNTSTQCRSWPVCEDHVCAFVWACALLPLHAGFIFAQQAVLYHMVHIVDIPKETHINAHTSTQRCADSHVDSNTKHTYSHGKMWQRGSGGRQTLVSKIEPSAHLGLLRSTNHKPNNHYTS